MKKLIEVRGNVIVNEQFKDGTYYINSAKPRNYKFLKKYWKLVDFTLFHLPETIDIKSKEVLHQYIKIKTDCVDVFQIKGEIVRFPSSVSFDKMNEEQFSDYYSRALDVCSGLIDYNINEQIVDQFVGFC